MNHVVVVSQIGDFVRDALSDRRRAELVEHFESCEECRELAAAYVTLSSGLQDDELQHPSSEQIVDFATDADGLDASSRILIGDHLEDCTACWIEVEWIVERESGLSPG